MSAKFSQSQTAVAIHSHKFKRANLQGIYRQLSRKSAPRAWTNAQIREAIQGILWDTYAALLSTESDDTWLQEI